MAAGWLSMERTGSQLSRYGTHIDLFMFLIVVTDPDPKILADPDQLLKPMNPDPGPTLKGILCQNFKL